MKKFEIVIQENGFTASVDGEQIAVSSSGNDLLGVFNQILAAVSPDVKVKYEDSKE